MAKQQCTRKRGFKPMRTKITEKSKRLRKNLRNKDEMSDSPSSSNSGDSFEEPSDVAAGGESEEDIMVPAEPSMYDNLLKTLGSGGKSIASAYKKGQRAEEGKSESDKDMEKDSESLSESHEVEDGSDDKSSISTLQPVNGKVFGLAGSIEHGVSESGSDVEASEMDEEVELRVNNDSVAQASASESSFNDHLEHKLSGTEVENLLRNKWKYRWSLPDVDIMNCKWLATKEFLLKDADVIVSYGLKVKLYDHWLDVYKSSGGADFHLSKQRVFFSLCNSYWDVLNHNKKPFYLKGHNEDSCIMDAYIMHSLNHVFRTRDLVTKNDGKLAKRQETAMDKIVSNDSFLDHGFTRPKVLILLPLASIAFLVVKRMIQLTPSTNKVNVEHFGRFSDEFGTQGSNEEQDEVNIDTSKSQITSKPSDFQTLFGGNNNDHFMMGIKFTRKSIKLYGDFYSSDIIVASPLGLITKIGEAEVEKEKDVDYLSSIEVLIIDHSDVIAMQNWSHVNSVVEQLNHIPSKQHGTDIMRVRQWYLDGLSKFYRQTIVLGSHVNPDINAFFHSQCHNYRGKVKSLCEHKGVLPKVLLQVRQIYDRFDAKSIVDADDARLDYFSKKVFPKINDSIQGGTMIFISSYFEFVRVRNFLKSRDASFCLLGEYTKQNDISRARVWFFQGKRKIMLYTERAHFYHRYKIRGIQNLVIYSLPERKEFYPEIVNMLEGSHSMTCTVLFSRFDQLKLERIAGTAPAKRMVTSDKDVFVFC